MRTALHGLSHLRSAHAPSMHTVMPPLVHSAMARWHGPGLRAGVARPTAQLLPPRAQAPAVVLHPSKPPEEVDTASLKRYKRAVAAHNVSATDIGLEPGIQYDPEWNKEYWLTRPVTVVSRLIRIGVAFARWLAYRRLNGEEAAARAMTDTLTDLGPAFVKIGQAVASRPDIVPPLYLSKLESLQDDIPPFSSEEAFATIEADLGAPVASIFAPLPTQPAAAASLGQVYKTKLVATGAHVAVKVQRPGLLPTIALDIFILRNLAQFVRRWKKTNSNLAALIDDWASSIYREMSYRQELRNAEEFARLFSHYPEVYVPRMFEDYSSERVLTMEWIDGEKPRRGSASNAPEAPVATTPVVTASAVAPPPKPQRTAGSAEDIALVEVGVRCSLEQMLQEGFYHADPHAGNILRMRDGRLCYLDFGMMGRIDERTRRGLVRATLHMVNREFDSLAEDFVTLGLLPDDAPTSRADIVVALKGIFDEALAGGVRNLNFGGLSTKLGSTMYRYKFRIPPYYTLLVRSLTILEGIALASDPNYKVLGAAYPWVARRLLTDDTPELQATLRGLLYKPNGGGLRFDRLEALLEQAVRSPPRPMRPAERGAGEAGPAPPSGGGNAGVELLLSGEGANLRGIIVDELAKGLDAAVRLTMDQATERARTLLLGRPSGAARGAAAAAPPPDPETPLGVALGAALSAAPRLADEADAEQVAGLQRLAALLQQLAAVQSRGGAPVGGAAAPPGGAPQSVAAAAQFVQWTVSRAAALPAAQQQALLRIPIDVVARLSSRTAARALRLLVSERDLRGT